VPDNSFGPWELKLGIGANDGLGSLCLDNGARTRRMGVLGVDGLGAR